MAEMSDQTAKALIAALSTSTPTTALSPGPAPASTTARAAVKRCCAAWKRAFNAHMEEHDNEYMAAEDAGKAYCNAMPLLLDYESIRAFMACLSHGMLIDAVPRERGGQLIYTAQVGLSILQRAPKPFKKPKFAIARTSKVASKPANSTSAGNSKLGKK